MALPAVGSWFCVDVLNYPETLKVSLRGISLWPLNLAVVVDLSAPSFRCSRMSLSVWGFSALLDIRFLLDNDTSGQQPEESDPLPWLLKTVSLSKPAINVKVPYLKCHSET